MAITFCTVCRDYNKFTRMTGAGKESHSFTWPNIDIQFKVRREDAE